MDPNSQGFNPDQNPFEAIINRSKAAQAPAPQPGMMPGMVENPNSPELPGQTGDNSKPLIMAIKSLHDYIAMSTDIRTQNMVRNLISMLTSLVSKDQQAGMKAGESAIEASGAPKPMPMPPQMG